MNVTKRKKMKSLVGYDVGTLNNYAVNVDRIVEVKKMSLQQITGSFYKIMLADKADLLTYKREVISILLLLCMQREQSKGKMYKKSFQEIANKVIAPRLNRGLYNQASISSSLREERKDQIISIMSASAVADNKFEHVLCYMMIMTGEHLDELLLSGRDVQAIVKKGQLHKKTFISMEDIINGHNNMQLNQNQLS